VNLLIFNEKSVLHPGLCLSRSEVLFCLGLGSLLSCESGLMVPALRIFHLLPSGHGLSTVVDLVSHGGISLLSFSWLVPIFCVKLCGSSLVLFAARCNSICSFGF
jgi:hypothetical protein